jgi:hypothetical protein
MAKKRKPSLWIKASGELVDVFPKGDKWALEEMQEKVGGYIELVGRTNMSPGRMMFVNEDGLLLGLHENNRASLMAGRRIVGDVLIVNANEVE